VSGMTPSTPRSPTPEHSGDEQAVPARDSATLPNGSSLAARPVHGLLIWCAAAGVLAGLLSWGGGELAWSGIRAAQSPRIVPFPTAEDRARLISSVVAATRVSFMQQGAILGAMLGLAGWLTRRDRRAGIRAVGVGGGLGALAGAAATQVLVPVYYHNVGPQAESLLLPLLTHGGLWAAIGAAAGLGLGIGLGGRGRLARAALGGLLGGIVAALIYDLVGAVVFPLDKTGQPVSATLATRLFAHMTAALVVTACAAFGAGDAPERMPDAQR
jgi:hypothetical protein